MSWNRRVLQTRLSHFRSPILAPLLLHHYHGLRTPSIAAALIHQPFGKRLGAARHLSSKEAKPSEGHTKIGNGMMPHVTKVTEWERPERKGPGGWCLKTYADDPLGSMRPVKAAQSALVTRHYAPPAKGYEYQEFPEICKDWKLYSIVVQSPLLRRVLESVLKCYSGDIPSYDSINISPEHVELRAPFKPFLKKRLEDAIQKEQDPETEQHLSLLRNVLEDNSSNTYKMIKENAANGIVYFEDLPLLFKPGAILVTLIQGQTQLVSLRELSYWPVDEDRHFLRLMCTCVDWTGTRFGREDVRTDLTIDEFKGPMNITDLPIYPLEFHPSRSEVERTLISRGKKFEAHKGYHYRTYNGIGIDDLDGLDDVIHVDSRVIIDTAAFYKLNPDIIEDMDDVPNDLDEMQLRLHPRRHCAAEESLSKKQLRLCAPMLRAFSVNDKKWLHIMVDDVKDIQWDDQAFKNLALPQEKKEMILAFANSQLRHEQNAGNVVQGKGNGVIVLCGPRGAEKTLTAEAIAEEMHAPLYELFGGELGRSPEEIEQSLITTLEFTAKWKAVLLLDDADAFVKTRSTYDGQHNDLVPIYQRILEYYDSVLFLNTNNAGGIDAAFESRVHRSSHYHEPEKTYDRVGDVFKEAQLLAMEQKKPLSLEHVKTVAQSLAADDVDLGEGPFYTRWDLREDDYYDY